MRLSWLGIILLASTQAQAMGNYPQAGACDAQHPWYAVCTHSLHTLEGWYGKGCYTEREPAEQEAKEHAKAYHKGNMRWTGVVKSREKIKGGKIKRER